MKSFNEIYAEVLRTSKEDLEKLRKKCFRRILGCIILFIFSFVIGLQVQGEAVMVISAVICIFLAVILIFGPANAYQKMYKETVVMKFIQEYDENLQFWYERGIPRSTYIEGGFENFDDYHSEDLIIGKIDGHEMMIAEVHTETESTDSEGHTTHSTVFHGLFGMSKLNTAYHGMIKIHADKGILGKIFQNKQRIEMDSSEFEKYFDVIADDKIQAMQILTSDVMDKMLDFIKTSKIKYELTIRDDKLYIRFKTGGMFEGNVFKSSVDFDTLKKVYDVINFTFDITRTLVKVTEETEL